jgi:hypothetical protein
VEHSETLWLNRKADRKKRRKEKEREEREERRGEERRAEERGVEWSGLRYRRCIVGVVVGQHRDGRREICTVTVTYL